MRTRAASAQATRQRIIGTMLELCLHRWYDEITLRELAAESGVALQTVINHFGTKEGVIAAMLEEAANRAGSITGGADGLQGMQVWPVLGLFRFDLYGRTAYVYCLALLFLGWLALTPD